MNINNYALVLLLLLGSCMNNGSDSDAFGNFESTEIIISSEGNGKLMRFDVEEGDDLVSGQLIGYIDSIGLYYKKLQLQARINSLYAKVLDIPSQINVLIERKNNLEREKNRIASLLQSNAATQKQLDDINGEIEVVNKELNANRERLDTNNKGLLAEIAPLKANIDEINDQIKKCLIYNPVKGTVLSKFAEENEITAFGKALYKIADLDNLYLRVYVSGSQLDNIKIGQNVTVLIDKDVSDFHSYPGKITWISEKSEFTPKIVQTKEERINLVYAIKVRVENDGKIKIGMPGEVKFQ